MVGYISSLLLRRCVNIRFHFRVFVFVPDQKLAVFENSVRLGITVKIHCKSSIFFYQKHSSSLDNFNEPELRAASCKTLAAVTKHLNDEEVKSKLQPILKKLAGDPI